MLLFELARAGGGEVGEGFFELGKARYAVVGEAAAGADAFLLGQLVYADAALALQFAPCPYAGDGEQAAHPGLAATGEVPCGVYAVVFELLCGVAAYAPYVGHVEAFECLDALVVGVDEACAVVAPVVLAVVGGYLGQCLCGGYAEGYGYACAAADGGYYLLAVGAEGVALAEAGKVDEGFVDGVLRYVGGEVGEEHHDAAAHVAVEGVVGAEHGYLVALEVVSHLIEGCAHVDAQGLGFVAARDDAAVVV